MILRFVNNHRQIGKVLSSLQPTVSMASFTLWYGTTLSPSDSTIVYNHEYDPTCQQLADLSSLYEVEMLYKSPAAQIGGIGGKSMLK